MSRARRGAWGMRVQRAALLTLTLALALCSRASAQQKIPLVLNRLTIELDSATYADVRNSPFILAQFAAVDTSLMNGYEGNHGMRLMGKYNFLTFTPPYVNNGSTGGDVEIVLATQRGGDLARLRTQGTFIDAPPLSTRGDGPARRAEQYTDVAERIVPSGADSVSRRNGLAIIEYALPWARAASRIDSLSENDRSGRRYLASYFDSRRLFSYLTGATLAISVDDIAKIVRVLQRDGVSVYPEGEGAIIKLDGFTLHLIPSYVGAGVKQLQFALTRSAVGNPIYQFGSKSQLRFGPGAIAVWDFDRK